MQQNDRPRRGGARSGAIVVRVVIGAALVIYTLLDELLFPIFRPLIRWLGALRLFERIGWVISHMPPYAVLVLLAVPLAVIEPAKVYALLLMATGHVVIGALALLLAQVASLLICERIYHVGHGQLMKIGWFKRLMGWIVALRDRAFGLVRETEFWQALARMAHRLRVRVRSMFRWLGRAGRE